MKVWIGLASGWTSMEKPVTADALEASVAFAAANELVAKEPKPASYVSSLGDFSVEITLLVWIADYQQDFDVTDQIYRQILVRFKEEGIEISYPVMTIMPRTA